MIEPYTSQAITNLKKTRGQMDKIISMIEEEKYCIDIIQQVNAALGLLKKTNNYILESHLLSCGTNGLTKGDEQARKTFVKDIIRVCNIASR